MNNKHFWHYQLISALPLLIAYLFLIFLLWLLVILYYMPRAFLTDTIRFSLPLLVIWEALDAYRSVKRVRAIQQEQPIHATNPVEKQLLTRYRSQQHTNQHTLRQLHNRQQEQFDHVELYSHEIKNSLTSLQAAAENNGTVSSQTVSNVVRQANHQLNMLLSDERLAMTNHDFQFEWVNLARLINDLLKQNSAIFIHQQQIPKLVNLERISVLTDQKWLRFCVDQLLSNANKYSPQGATITIRWVNDCLQIIDHGVGIPASDLPRIYDNGFSGHNGHQTTKSTGMGLYLVKQVAKQLNFELTIDSELGNGTTASLHFPSDNIRMVD